MMRRLDILIINLRCEQRDIDCFFYLLTSMQSIFCCCTQYSIWVGLSRFVNAVAQTFSCGLQIFHHSTIVYIWYNWRYLAANGLPILLLQFVYRYNAHDETTNVVLRNTSTAARLSTPKRLQYNIVHIRIYQQPPLTNTPSLFFSNMIRSGACGSCLSVWWWWLVLVTVHYRLDWNITHV